MKDIVKIVHLPSVVQSEFNKVTRTLFLGKENKNNDLTIRLRSAILERIHWTQNAYAVLCQPHHTDTFSTFIYTLIWTKTAYPCGAADTEQRTQFASSGYSPKWRYGDRGGGDELSNSCYFCFLCAEKSVLVASLNSDWTTDGSWTILTMSFILFWALTVLFTWQSMGQSQASRF